MRTMSEVCHGGLLLLFVTVARAQAADVAFVLSLNDNGNGVNTAPGAVAVYAYVPGDGNAGNRGLASFSFSIDGLLTIVNRSPQATFYDGADSVQTAGFSVLRVGNAGAAQGTQDVLSGNGIPVYGIGTTNVNADVPRDLRTFQPAGYTLTTSASQAVYGYPVLLATGTFNGTPAFITGSAYVFSNAAAAVRPATVNFQTVTLIPEPATAAVIGVTGIGLFMRQRSGRAVATA